ncbi:PAS domain-containing protein [Marivibrio halodurans]|uniref:PAS domain-containing protein n=1 Tax=Marivibrio halodurans TaxID=2039722 RepID=A0A8J7V413_9PROT|nr:PAS domain-containing protein [Marivibrio halodurans]MBP5857194.1 PAS domain-containing protein [Marivibrio halodurans]
MTQTRRRFGTEMEPVLDAPGARLLAFWHAHGTPGRPPKRTDFDPTAHPRALSGIQIVEREEGPARYRYRLVGTGEVQARGLDPTGKPVSEGYFASSLDIVMENYDRVIAEARPMAVEDAFRDPRGLPIQDISLLLPLIGEDGSPTFILVYSYQRDLPRDHPMWMAPNR